MKKIFIILGLFTTHGFCIDNTLNPGIHLNCQDVPIFYNGNPLEGLSAFAVISSCSSQSAEVNRRITEIIAQELGTLGIVIKNKSEEGFGTGNILHIQIGRVSKWDGKELPISRATLNIESPVIISKTHVKSVPRIWSINDFIDAPLNNKSEDEACKAIQRLLREFIKNYRFANPNQKPLFYIY